MAFQFLLGRLKTMTAEFSGLMNEMFQFLLGRLKTSISAFGPARFGSVSIPAR